MVESKGYLFTSVRVLDFSFMLYSLKDFYVEIVFNHCDESISEITPFKEGGRMEKYLYNIERKLKGYEE